MISATDATTSSTSDGNGEVSFCAYCGIKLDVGARFCKGCGRQVEQPSQDNSNVGAGKQSNEHITERKIIYEGYIHKCPNCGEVLESFTTNCPSCGFEIRGAKSASTVQEFALKLERIEAQKMPAFEEKKSVMKMVFGKDFKAEDTDKEAKDNFIKQKQQEKATLILNYSIPNTKEDIMEFILLTTSNIDVKHGIDDVVSKAWISKLEQVYQKAEFSMGSGTDFAQIKNIYENNKKKIKGKEFQGVLKRVGLYAFLFLLMGMLWDPIATITIFIIFIILLVVAVIIFKKR